MRYLLETECLSRCLPGSGECIKKSGSACLAEPLCFHVSGNKYARLSAKAGGNRQTVPIRCKQRRNSNRQSANQGDKKDGYERNRIRQAKRSKGRATRSAACPCFACRNICGCSHVAISFGLVLDEQSLAYRRPKRKGFPAIFQRSTFCTNRPKTDSVFFVAFCGAFRREAPVLSAKKSGARRIFLRDRPFSPPPDYAIMKTNEQKPHRPGCGRRQG